MKAKPLFHTEANPARANRLKAVEDVAERIGFPLLPWVRRALEVSTEHDADGIPYRRRALWTVPRQSGKSVALASVAIESMQREDEKYAVYIAQTRAAGRNRLAGIAKLLLRSGLDRGARFTRGVGNERLNFSNGSVIEVMSPDASSVHGESLDDAYLDEVFAIDPLVLSGVTPAMAARPKAQLWMISTAGTLADSELLNRLRDEGREDPDGPMSFVEYGLPPDVHPTNSDEWHNFHPGLGYTTTMAHLRDEARTMPLPEWLRAYGNRSTAIDEIAFPLEWWKRSVHARAVPVGICIAVDVSRLGVTVAAAHLIEDGHYHFDAVEYRPASDWAWAIDRVRDLLKFSPQAVALDQTGPGAGMIPELQRLTEDAGIIFRRFSNVDRTRSDGFLYELLKEERVTHGPLEALDESVESTPTRASGDAWLFSRRGAVADPSPLIASSMALFTAYEVEELHPKPAIFS